MHEQSLMNGLMEHIHDAARRSGATRVTKIKVRLGKFAHMSPSHFREHFAEASKGGVAADASVEVVLDESSESATAQDIVLESIDVES